MCNRARNQPIAVAVISGLVMTTYQISFGSLIFSGNLAAHLSVGFGFYLMGVVLIGAIEALFSGNPGMVAMSQVVLLYSQLTHDAVPSAAHTNGDGVISQTLRRDTRVLDSFRLR